MSLAATAIVAGVATTAYSVSKSSSLAKKAGSKQARQIAEQAEAERNAALEQRRAAENDQLYQESLRFLQTSQAQAQAASGIIPGVSNNALYAVGISAVVIGAAGLALAKRRK